MKPSPFWRADIERMTWDEINHFEVELLRHPVAYAYRNSL